LEIEERKSREDVIRMCGGFVFEENCGLKGKKFKRWGDVR
jgi:hypothetical protein